MVGSVRSCVIHDAFESPHNNRSTRVCVCLCVSKTDSVQSRQCKIIDKPHLISRYKSSVALKEGTNLRKPSDHSACFYRVFMSLTEKVILSVFFFFLLNHCFSFLSQFHVLMIFFEVMHELGRVFLSTGTLTARFTNFNHG